MVEKSKNLTERKFRGYWEQTEGDERARFRAVLELIQAPNRPNIGREIVKQFADGKWHAREVIAKAINAERSGLDRRATFAAFDWSRWHSRQPRLGVRPATWPYLQGLSA